MISPVRIATRSSPLALAQARWVAAELRRIAGIQAVLVPVVTSGDTATGPISQLGGTGLFVTAVREALLAGQADLAVHSLKDLPTAPCPGLVLVAVPERADPRDALVGFSQGIAELPPGARLGTGSPRRAAQLLRLRPDLLIVDIRGNVETRLAKVDTGELTAVVLARAGLDRLGLDVVNTPVPTSDLVPAPGQGALAVEGTEAFAADGDAAAVLAALDDPAARAATTAERVLLAELEAGCTAPVGAYASVFAPDTPAGVQLLELTSVVTAVDGTQEIRMSTTGPISAPAELGSRLTAELLAAGAASLIGEPLL